MPVGRRRTSESSDITVNDDIDMLGLYQVVDLASPASGEALRKGNRDITTAEISLTAGITIAQLVNTYLLPTIMTTRGDLVYRGASYPGRIPAGDSGQHLVMGVDDPAWTTVSLPTAGYKTDDEIVNNSDTLQNSEGMLIAVGANDVWFVVMLMLMVSASTTPDISYAFALPSGGAMSRYLVIAETASVSEDATVAQTVPLVTSVKYTIQFCLYKGGGTAGNIQHQWAQNTATAENTTLKEGSFLLGFKLE